MIDAVGLQMSSRPAKSRCVEPIGPIHPLCPVEVEDTIFSFLSLSERGSVRCTEKHQNPKYPEGDQYLNLRRQAEDRIIKEYESNPTINEAMLSLLRDRRYNDFVLCVQYIPNWSHQQAIGYMLRTENSVLFRNCVENISKWLELQTLDLHFEWKYIRFLPSSFGNLRGLTTLDLSWNNLETLDPTFGNLTNLKILDLAGNVLTSLPSEFGKLTKLTELDLSQNNLVSLPPTFQYLIELVDLDLQNNRLTSLPSEFGNLTKLETIDLDGNEIDSSTDSLR